MHDSVDELWADAYECVVADGHDILSRDGDSREVIGWQAKLDAGRQRTFMCNSRRALSPVYAAAETLWYMSGRAEVEMMTRYSKKYAAYAEADGKAHGAYGPRVMPQMPLIVEAIRGARRSRQAVIVIFEPGDLAKVVVENSVKDVPCTLSMQWLVRSDELHLVVTMRSNDIWLGLPYDVFAFTCFQRVLAAHLDAAVGTYTHNVGSLHLYDRNMPAAEEAYETYRVEDDPPDHGWFLDDTLSTCEVAARCEERARTHRELCTSFEALGNMTHDLVALCANHCEASVDVPVSSPALREGLENLRRRRDG